MEKVVSRAIKIDLHMHSYFSKDKDGKKVAKNTKDNLKVLIKGLIDNSVNMVSITDHDTFNYDLYKELKKQEAEKNCIKKVLPGIEFTVEFSPNIPIHIVTIFDDSDDKKVKNIETVMTKGIGKTLYSASKKQFSRKDYIDVLDAIGVDFVMIAHQKKSLKFENEVKKNDVLSLGRETFDELVFMDYFDAFEFRNKKNELYNKYFRIEEKVEDNVRFITGSDCHCWDNYPYTEATETKNFTFTYLKSLPTFRGLAMAITDNHRIAYEEKFFNPVEKNISSIKLMVDNKPVDVPLSKGINVIIGDNSIGKSLFLHELTGNYKLKDKGVQRGYKKYLEKETIVFKSKIPEEEIFMFNTQGEIRGIFDKEGLKPDTYLKQFYPTEINASKYRAIVDNELLRLYDSLKRKFQYDKHKSELPDLTIDASDYSPVDITFIGEKAKIDDKEVRNIVDGFEKIQIDFESVIGNRLLRVEDKKHLLNIKETVGLMRKKYEEELQEIRSENIRINAYSTFINDYKLNFSKRVSDEHSIYSNFVSGKENVIKSIVNLIQERQSLVNYVPNNINVDIEVEKNPVDKYFFVSKLGIEKIDSAYINSLIQSVLKKGKKIDTLSITEKELGEYIKNNAEDAETIETLEAKINAILDKDFMPKNSIVEAGMDVYQDVSAGFDAQMYFTLICGETADKGIYIIDQPEDHISQKAIKDKVLNQFRKMGSCRQVIMVTHNPQFIINLDVDNVIFLSEENGKFSIKSGALEYQDNTYSILDVVAENVEGGLTQIQGRLKRYEKKLCAE